MNNKILDILQRFNFLINNMVKSNKCKVKKFNGNKVILDFNYKTNNITVKKELYYNLVMLEIKTNNKTLYCEFELNSDYYTFLKYNSIYSLDRNISMYSFIYFLDNLTKKIIAINRSEKRSFIKDFTSNLMSMFKRKISAF